MKLESCLIELDDWSTTIFERAWFRRDGQWIMIIPITDDHKIMLIEHFCVGSEQKEIVLPWGARDDGYTVEDIANKELQEEIGMKASHITSLTNLHILPWYVKAKTMVCVATGLTPSVLQGDEFENIIVHTLSRDDIMTEIDQGIINDCRTIAALMYYKQKVESNK